MYVSNLKLIDFAIEVIVFIILIIIGDYLIKKSKESSYKIFNITELIPMEEVHSLRQMAYLIMMGFFFIDILYTLVFTKTDNFYLAIFDIVLMLYLAITLDKSSIKNKILVILLIPYGSMTYIIYGSSLVGMIDLIHIPVLIYFIKVYYDKFREYTLSNGLGISVILLFLIVFISFLATQLFESVNPLDSLVMVSNAFTSNGYAVLGHSIPGKMNAIILVWGGYLLSGVGTATLTAGILINYFNRKIDAINEKLDKIEEANKKE